QCADGSCIAGYLKCDGSSQCPDRSDEEDCTVAEQGGCVSLLCDEPAVCIPKNWVCDNITDCSDGLDEKHCGSYGGDDHFLFLIR
ncbi:hypothetical protein HELRODRAFT_77969, partial [Helobdella robusta]|uniref:Uncharacterized protein n=1 Tax=Helobdella robusta TaxID=6412 RepID=T1G358_HELRO